MDRQLDRLAGWSEVQQWCRSLASKLGFADVDDWNVLVLDHVLDAVLHGDREERDKVDEQDGPEYRNVEEWEEGTEERYQKCSRRREPRQITIDRSRQIDHD